MNKIFKIPVTWEVTSEIEIEAEDLDTAIRIFDEFERGVGHDLPIYSHYVDGSFQRECIELCELVNEDVK